MTYSCSDIDESGDVVMKHLFIINPTAGKKPDPYRLRAEIDAAIKTSGEECVVRFTERTGHATQIAREVVSDGQDWRVYACGGDGTLNEVLNGVAGYSNAALTQVACGTGNDFLRLFDPQDNSHFRDITALILGEERELDLIEFDGRFSINICSVGLDARIARDVHKFSKLPLMTGFGAFTTSALYNVAKGLSDNYTVTADGEQLDDKYALICLSNARFYGGGYMPMGDADPSDGILDLLLIKHVNRAKVLTLLGKYKEGRYEDLGGIAIRRAVREVRIGFNGREESVNMDGEMIPARECVMRLSDKKQRFFAPYGSFSGFACEQIERKPELARQIRSNARIT